MNVGFLYTKEKFDYLVVHDVDLIPLNENISYDYPKEGIYNILAPWLHPDDHYVCSFADFLMISQNIFN